MNKASQPRTAVKIIGDLLDAANAAAEIVARGKDAWDHDRLLRLADEAVISRIGDAAAKLPDDVKAAPPKAHRWAAGAPHRQGSDVRKRTRSKSVA